MCQAWELLPDSSKQGLFQNPYSTQARPFMFLTGIFQNLGGGRKPLSLTC